MRAQSGILAIWHDIAPDQREAVLNWYDREHHFERLSVPGFRSMRRYVAVAGTPDLFICYETDDVAVLSSPAYLARLNDPTPWTLRSQSNFLNNSRTVCHRQASGGHRGAGFAVPLRFLASRDRAVPAEIAARIAIAADGLDGVTGWEIWRADTDRSSIASREKEIRGTADIHADTVIVTHAVDLATAEKARAALENAVPESLRSHCHHGTYQLSFFAEADETA